jgi:hypothetical protein
LKLHHEEVETGMPEEIEFGLLVVPIFHHSIIPAFLSVFVCG